MTLQKLDFFSRPLLSLLHFLWSFRSLFQQHSSTATVKKGPPCVLSNKKLTPLASDIVQLQMAELCTTEEAFSQLLYGFCVGCSINSTTHVATSALVKTSAHTGTHIPTEPAHTNTETHSRHIRRACGCDHLLLSDCKICSKKIFRSYCFFLSHMRFQER